MSSLNNNTIYPRSVYMKPTMSIVEVKFSGMMCSSPDMNTTFFLGGGGVYGEESIVDNGDY